jgi:hypothetical protein
MNLKIHNAVQLNPPVTKYLYESGLYEATNRGKENIMHSQNERERWVLH